MTIGKKLISHIDNGSIYNSVYTSARINVSYSLFFKIDKLVHEQVWIFTSFNLNIK